MSVSGFVCPLSGDKCNSKPDLLKKMIIQVRSMLYIYLLLVSSICESQTYTYTPSLFSLFVSLFYVFST